MITTDLYADGLTYTTTGNRVNRFSVFANLTPDAPAVDTSPYYLGWIKPENIPADAHYCKGEHVGNGVYKFTDDMDKANFPLGYVVTSTYAFSDYFMVDDSITGSGFNQYRYINQLYPMYCAQQLATSDNYLFAFIVFIYDAGDNYLGRSLVQSFQKVNGTTPPARYKFKELYYMLTNLDYTYTVDLGTYGTATFTGHDWENGTFYVETSTGGHARFFFAQYLIYPNLYIQGQSSSFSMRVMPFIRFTYDNGAHSRHIGIVGTHTGTANTTRVAYAESSGATLSMSGRRYGMEGTVDTSNLSSTNKYTWDGNVLAIFGEDSSHPTRIAFYPFFRLSDFRRTVSLYFRIDNSPRTNGYVLGTTWATNVTPDDEFLAELKTGDFADTNFKNSLRPWQYEDFQADDFTAEDIPQPTPGPGPRPEPVPPGDNETDGDDADMNIPTGIGNGFGFTTMYGIRASHLSEIGAKLWSGFSDVTDYINNFVFAVDPTTGSVNLSDIMQFFISLRAYPCPLSAMASTSAGGTDMYIGSGAAPLSLTTPFSIVDSYIGYIDAGSVDIPFWYGDYRDYALEIICYLPYCGTVQLNAGDVMGGTLSAYYTVDFCSGACMAYVLCTTWEDKTILVGSLPGQLGADIPMTATNAGQVMARMYGDRINVAENLLSAAKNGATGIGAVMSGNVAGAIRSGISAFIDPALANERQLSEMGSRSAIAAPMLSGGRGLAAFGTSKTAYVQIRSPFYTEPANYDHAVGTPAASAVRIGDCTGFCQFVNVDVTGIVTDADDQNAIRAALESGVII